TFARRRTMTKRHCPLFINGERVETASGGTEETFDPSTGRPFASFTVAGTSEVEAAVNAARTAFEAGSWTRMRSYERGQILHRVAAGLTARRDEIAKTMVEDSGKPLRDGYWEVDCSARFFEFYAGMCDK